MKNLTIISIAAAFLISAPPYASVSAEVEDTDRKTRRVVSTRISSMFVDERIRSLWPSDDTVPGREFVEPFGCSVVVTSTANTGVGSLREAINCSNLLPGTQTISFAIPGAGPHMIAPTSALPAISSPAIVDGYTQPGASANTMATGNNAVLRIELRGGGGFFPGLQLTGGGTTVRGLVINRFSSGIDARVTGNNVITGNFLGTDTTGTSDLGNADHGVLLVDSSGNLIGGTSPAARNVISGNNNDGIQIVRGSGNMIQGNYIGTTLTGASSRANNDSGVQIVDSSLNTIGGTASGAGNLISFNGGDGIFLEMPGSSDNVIEGNIIGTNLAGSVAFPNNGSGIGINNGASGNRIGGTSVAARNLISGNGNQGVDIRGPGTGNLVLGNYIGTNATGTSAVPNDEGVRIEAPGTFIGGINPNARNVISGNREEGVRIRNIGRAAIAGAAGSFRDWGIVFADGEFGVMYRPPNVGDAGETLKSGVPATVGTFFHVAATNNGQTTRIFVNGIERASAPVDPNYVGDDRFLIGGEDCCLGRFPGTVDEVTVYNRALASNEILTINNAGSAGKCKPAVVPNCVQPPSGVIAWYPGDGSTADISGNGRNGFFIGAPTYTPARVLQGFDLDGIDDYVDTPNFTPGSQWTVEAWVRVDSAATGINIQGNLIGTDATGTVPLPNGEEGVFIDSAGGNFVGGSQAGAGNVISGNSRHGVEVSGPTAADNQISGNRIGTNATGTGPLGNTLHGVYFFNSGPNIVGGGFSSNHPNTIAHNGGDGVAVVFGGVACIKKGIIDNSIHSNGGLGIDLGDDGVTFNDQGDGDTGPNTLQNFPVLTSAVVTGNSIAINGTLNSTPNTSFYIEFYSNQAADPSGHGEGQTYLGALSNVMTNASGNATFTASLPTAPPQGQMMITATTSDNADLANTSEFSQAIQATTGSSMITISGQVLSPTGIALRNVEVKLFEPQGNERTALTSSFGFYSFTNVQAGQQYTLTARNKRYRFSPVVQTFNSSTTINFTGLE